MYQRLENFLTKFNILSPNQFGFRKGKSCNDAISSLMEYVYSALNRKEFIASVFLDLKKAYDTVNHGILLKKLFCCGVRGTPLKWFESYLERRSQCVKIQDSISSQREVTIGIPQGSVLGGLLFLIYVNDLPSVSEKLFCVLFADDTCLAYSHTNYNDLINELNVELEKVCNWLEINRLSLNLLKTVAIDFSNKRHSDHRIILNNTPLEYVSFVKYLGIYIDKKLSFSKHIEEVCGKISKSIGIMYRVSSFCPKNILMKLYYALIYPYLIYCNIIWGGAYPSHINKILLLQKRTIMYTHYS